MADRRMFSTKIVESDAFYDLMPTAQALYLHLCMAADDDGFINNPRSVVRGMGCHNSHLEELIKKRFLIELPSGIVCIKHWRINNYIQKDRYKETVYTEEKRLVYIKENGAYTLNPDHCIQGTDDPVSKVPDTLYTDSVSKVSDPMDTQNSIDKDRLGKDSIGKDSKEKGREVNTFTPPTLSELQAYCHERNNDVDPEHFLDYYEARGWILSNGKKCRDWKACVRTWEKKEWRTAPSVPHKSINQQNVEAWAKYLGKEITDDKRTDEELLSLEESDFFIH